MFVQLLSKSHCRRGARGLIPPNYFGELHLDSNGGCLDTSLGQNLFPSKFAAERVRVYDEAGWHLIFDEGYDLPPYRASTEAISIFQRLAVRF